jgi:hypothetical protein
MALPIRKKYASTLFSLAAALLAGVVLYRFEPGKYFFYPVCPFYKLTGLYCPGCGSLRAVHSLTHGNFLTAFGFNPLLFLWSPVLLWMLSQQIAAELRGRTASTALTHPIWGWLALGVIVAFTVLRNLPFAPFAWMSP